MITSCLSSRLAYSKTTPTACTPNSIQLPIYTHASLSPVITTPGLFTRFHVPHATSLRAAATEFSPAITSQWTMPSPSLGPSLLSQSQTSPQFSEQSDAWLTIAQAIKQGPSLPKVELAKFSGDPLEYAEFVTNFKDNIESQLADESQRLTRLLAQYIGKAREAIRSCVNLPVGHRYSEAWKTLHENFGQPHMIVEAHMKKLRDIQAKVELTMQILLVSSKGLQSVSTTDTYKSLSHFLPLKEKRRNLVEKSQITHLESHHWLVQLTRLNRAWT